MTAVTTLPTLTSILPTVVVPVRVVPRLVRVSSLIVTPVTIILTKDGERQNKNERK